MARWSGPNIRRNLWYLYSATRLCPQYLPSPHCVSVTCAFFFRIVRAASKFKPISRLAQRLTTQIEIGHAAVSRASAARTARRIRPTMRKLTWRLTLALNGRPLGPEASGRREMNSAPAARRSETCHGPLERVVRRLFHRTCQPFPSNCTDAHAGPPSLARPKICASSSFDVFDITESIIDHDPSTLRPAQRERQSSSTRIDDQADPEQQRPKDAAWLYRRVWPHELVS